VHVCRRLILFAVLTSVVCVPPLARVHQRITPPNAPSQEATRFNPRADGIPKRATVAAPFVIVSLLVDACVDDSETPEFVHASAPPDPFNPPALPPLGLRAPPRQLFA
jgi:hypothetical protein